MHLLRRKTRLTTACTRPAPSVLFVSKQARAGLVPGIRLLRLGAESALQYVRVNTFDLEESSSVPIPEFCGMKSDQRQLQNDPGCYPK